MTHRQFLALVATLIVLLVAGLTIQRYSECAQKGGRLCLQNDGVGIVGPSIGPGIR